MLERTFQTTNTIRLYEAAVSDGVFDKKLLIEWDVNGMRNGDGSKVSDLQVDNYEGMCLCPEDHNNQRRLILVNDDNDNQDQIGTQFVLLALNRSTGHRQQPGLRVVPPLPHRRGHRFVDRSLLRRRRLSRRRKTPHIGRPRRHALESRLAPIVIPPP